MCCESKNNITAISWENISANLKFHEIIKKFLDVIRRFQFSFPMEKFHVLWGIIKIVARNLDSQRYKSLRIFLPVRTTRMNTHLNGPHSKIAFCVACTANEKWPNIIPILFECSRRLWELTGPEIEPFRIPIISVTCYYTCYARFVAILDWTPWGCKV